MGSVETSGDAPRAGRKSLSTEQIRDPLATLASAYGVERDLSHVALTVTERLPRRLADIDFDIDLDAVPFEARFTAVFGIVARLVLDGRNLGRVYRGSPLARFERTSMTGSVSFHIGSVPAERFIDIVCREIRSALG